MQACHLSAEAGWGGAEGTLDSGADPGFFLGGVALVSCSTSTPINHIVFFCRKPVVLENRRSSQTRGGEGGAHPLHPPPRSAPEIVASKSGSLQTQSTNGLCDETIWVQFLKVINL